jgi:lysophospholipase L1-like esterase
MTYLGGSAVAGGKLKEAGTVHWKTPNTGATNESKLSIPGSGLAGIDGATTQLTEHATLWALNNVGNTAIRYYLSNVASSFNRQAGLLRKYGMSLRMIFTQNKVVGDTIILGDSTITSFGNEGSVAEHLGVVGTLTDLSTSGETIDQQKTRYNALSSGVKTGAKYIFIEIGLNDPQAYTIAQVMARYQVMINDIKAGSPQAIIIAATLTPCRGQRGSGYDFILLMDEAIKGYGANAITGIDRVATYHTKWIGDAVGNLLTEFTIDPAVDKIHENRAGRMLIAKSWLSKV